MSTGRMEAFSDGVIAILITVMVLELPTPNGTEWSALHEALPVMHPGRVDVIGAGALVLRVIMDVFELTEVVVSEHDILDGIALRLARS